MNNQHITSNINYTNLEANRANKLRVGVMAKALPFSDCSKYKNDDKSELDLDYDGITVKLWEQIAMKYHLHYEYICVDETYENAIIELGKDKYDLILGDFTLVPRRLESALFTRPFYISEIRIFRKANNTFLHNLLSSNLFIGLFVLFFIIILGFTFVYKNFKHTSFLLALYKTYSEFFTNEMYFFDTNSNSNYVKFINLSWSIIRFFFFAVIITQLINIILQTNYSEITENDLKNINEIYGIEGTTWIDFIKNMGKTPVPVKNLDELKRKFLESNGDIYWLHETQNAIATLGNIGLEKTERPIVLDELTIAVNKKRPDILDIINTTLVQLQDSGEMLKICKGYLPDRYDACLL